MSALSSGRLASQTARAAQAPPRTPVTFTKDVAPILVDRCGTCHHPEGPAPFSLVTYPTARSHATQILAAVKSGFMPPWKSEPGYGTFVGQRHVTASEVAILERWVAPGVLRLRVGDYRVLYEVHDAVLIVLVLRSGLVGAGSENGPDVDSGGR